LIFNLKNKIILVIAFIFLAISNFILQSYDYYDFVYIHFYLIVFYLVFININKLKNIKQIFFLILIYTAFLVSCQYTFNIIYFDNPLGYNPIDAKLYNEIGVKISKLNFLDMINYISVNLSVADIGYPFLLWFVYSQGLDSILIMKIINIIFHLITCYYVYKLSKVFFNNLQHQKLSFVLYAINPFVVYFSSSGLKEIYFCFFIIVGFYYLYKGNVKLKYYFIGFFLIACTGFFRVYIPFLILSVFGIYLILKQKGKLGILKKFIILLIFISILFIVFGVVQSELSGKIQTDSNYILEYRLGRVPTILDRVLLFIGGLFGPFPSFQYSENYIINLLETTGNFIKLFLSGYFVIGAYFIFKNRMIKFYPLIFVIVLNTFLLSILGLSLEPRFSFIFHFIYYIIVVLGYSYLDSSNRVKTYNKTHLIAMLLLVLFYNMR